MSRIGKKPVAIPAGVTVQVAGSKVTVKGKHGELSLTCHPRIKVCVDEAAREVRVERPSDDRESRALHGLTRALINNMVQGVNTPWEKKLEIQGVGYQASLSGKTLTLQVGFANAIKLSVPSNVVCELPDNTHINLRSADRQAVGQFAAEIRSVRPPEPYKGKGIRYVGERVRRKAGKAFGS
jgi:large subunit ribosomal protein L6|uniref:Large ribosomal subunit protein uL6 n=1 Tax=Schlesneria paludicola TaxID=360056 RepID=A0A7C4LKT3_9PLAN